MVSGGEMPTQYPPKDPQLEEMADRVQSLVNLVVAARLRAESSQSATDTESGQGLHEGTRPRQH